MVRAVNSINSKLACGLDPGIRHCNTGYAILESMDGCSWILREYGLGSVGRALQSIATCPVVGVDSPIHPPYKGFRRVEKAAIRYGAKFLPGGSKGMRDLARIGYSIALFLCHKSSIPVETHPGSIRLLHGLERGSLGFGSSHVEDAFLSAIAAASAICGACRWFIEDDGIICIPKGKLELSIRGDTVMARIRVD